MKVSLLPYYRLNYGQRPNSHFGANSHASRIGVNLEDGYVDSTLFNDKYGPHGKFQYTGHLGTIYEQLID